MISFLCAHVHSLIKFFPFFQRQKKNRKWKRNKDVIEVCLNDRKIEQVCDFSKYRNLQFVWLSNNRVRLFLSCAHILYEVMQQEASRCIFFITAKAPGLLWTKLQDYRIAPAIQLFERHHWCIDSFNTTTSPHASRKPTYKPGKSSQRIQEDAVITNTQ